MKFYILKFKRFKYIFYYDWINWSNRPIMAAINQSIAKGVMIKKLLTNSELCTGIFYEYMTLFEDTRFQNSKDLNFILSSSQSPRTFRHSNKPFSSRNFIKRLTVHFGTGNVPELLERILNYDWRIPLRQPQTCHTTITLERCRYPVWS